MVCVGIVWFLIQATRAESTRSALPHSQLTLVASNENGNVVFEIPGSRTLPTEAWDVAPDSRLLWYFVKYGDLDKEQIVSRVVVTTLNESDCDYNDKLLVPPELYWPVITPQITSPFDPIGDFAGDSVALRHYLTDNMFGDANHMLCGYIGETSGVRSYVLNKEQPSCFWDESLATIATRLCDFLSNLVFVQDDHSGDNSVVPVAETNSQHVSNYESLSPSLEMSPDDRIFERILMSGFTNLHVVRAAKHPDTVRAILGARRSSRDEVLEHDNYYYIDGLGNVNLRQGTLTFYGKEVATLPLVKFKIDAIPERHILRILVPRDSIPPGTYETAELVVTDEQGRSHKVVSEHLELVISGAILATSIGIFLLATMMTRKPPTVNVYMRDNYQSSGPVGAIGPGAIAHHNNINQLLGEMATLRESMGGIASTAEQVQSVREVGEAERALKANDQSKANRHLTNAGKWALGVAEKIGANLAAAVLKDALGL